MIREIDDGSDGTQPMNIHVKLSAFNKNIVSRKEMNVTKVTDLIYNQHLVIDAQDVKANYLEQNKLTLSVYNALNLISEFTINILTIYYQPKHCYLNKWLGMIHPKNEPTKIRSIMKISAQLTGPSDEQSKLTLDISDYKTSSGKLILPPQLNPLVYQYLIKIFRGRNMNIDTSFLGFTEAINPRIRVTLGE